VDENNEWAFEPRLDQDHELLELPYDELARDHEELLP
jgi:hypothetical protein